MRAERIARVIRKFGLTQTQKREAIKVVNGAVKLLKNGKNWTKGDYENRDGEFCLIGAVNNAWQDDNVVGSVALIAVELAVPGPGVEPRLIYETDTEYLTSTLAARYEDDATTWNDVPARTFKQVKSVLLRAKTALTLSLKSERQAYV